MAWRADQSERMRPFPFLDLATLAPFHVEPVATPRLKYEVFTPFPSVRLLRERELVRVFLFGRVLAKLGAGGNLFLSHCCAGSPISSGCN
jgi:hypothetical protein